MKQEQGPLLQGHRELLVEGLKRIFGDFNQEMLERVLPRFEWIELSGGQVLFRQGEQDDSLYFVISGRLRAVRSNEDGERAVLGEIARGETVGELAFFTGEPRIATIVAVRDTLLARVSSEVFRELLVAYPLVSLNLTRLVIDRMKRSGVQKGGIKPVTLGFIAATPDIDVREAAERLAQSLGDPGATQIVTSQQVDQWLGEPGASQTPRDDIDGSARLVQKLEQVEIDNQYVLFVADASATEWTRRCLRHCDKVLVLADARRDPTPGAIETECFSDVSLDHQPACTLVLFHPPGTRAPSGTARWLTPRNAASHFHLRRDQPADWARLARVVAGT